MVQHVLVLGGGSAGLIAALSLKTRMPRLAVRVLRSADIGIIGVGEGTTQQFPRYFFTRLGLPPGPFYAETQPEKSAATPSPSWKGWLSSATPAGNGEQPAMPLFVNIVRLLALMLAGGAEATLRVVVQDAQTGAAL